MTVDRLDVEIERINELSFALIDEYLSWGDKILVGEVQQWMYHQVIEFVNFRIETAHTCLEMIRGHKIADALGLCRSVLEHYLLLILICRGQKFFKLVDRTDLKESEFKELLRSEQETLARRHQNGDASCLAVEKYPRAKRHLMYVFEGLIDKDEPDFKTPVHFFHFENFRPEVMRLKREDYFEYFEMKPDAKKMLDGHRQEVGLVYRYYLSYDGLLQCLELNGLVDLATLTRIEAHYTYLGKFLHPTHDAARELHDPSNIHEGRPAVGMSYPYSQVAVLLASLYVCYLLTGLLDEITGLIAGAPKKYIADSGVDPLRKLLTSVNLKFPYFWFLFNDPPLYDKYNYGIHHATPEELKTLGHYSKIPNDRIPFDQHVYSHLQQALTGWHNSKCGVYVSPLES